MLQVPFMGKIWYFIMISMRISSEMLQTRLDFLFLVFISGSQSGPQDNLGPRGNSSVADSACPVVPVISAGTFLRSRPIHSPKTRRQFSFSQSRSSNYRARHLVLGQPSNRHLQLIEFYFHHRTEWWLSAQLTIQHHPGWSKHKDGY